MATGATGQLGLALPVQGELSGTWGDTVNNGLTQYTNIAIAGTLTLTGDGAVTLANTTGDASASNITSTLTGAGTVTAQFAIVRVTGTLTTAKIITGPSYSKTYLVVNAATGSTVSFIRAGQTPAISIAVGESAFVYFNGTDYVKVAGTAAVSSFSAGTTGLTPNTATTGAVTLAGTLATTNGGTGLTSFTSGGVVYASSTSALATGSALQFTGTNLGLGTTNPDVFSRGDARILGIASTANAAVAVNAASGSTSFLQLGSNGVRDFQIQATSSAVTLGTGASGANPIIFALGFNEYMRLTSTGLGIGTSSPTSKLSVNGVIQVTSGGNPSSGAGWEIGYGTVNAGRTALQSYNRTGSAYLGADYNSLDHYFYTSGTERFRIASTGAFGLSGANYGTSGQVLTSGGSGAAPTWTTVSGGGDVVGPASAVANSIALFNSTTGKLIKDSSASDGLIYGLTVGRGSGAIASNMAVGLSALGGGSQTGIQNTAVGYQAMLANTSGSYNTAFGFTAMSANTTGEQNAAFGREALQLNTTGNYNTASGMSALRVNTTGVNNSAFGFQALVANTTASNNTAVGYQALFNNTNGSTNIAVGYQAGYGLRTNTLTPGQNIAIGNEALYTASHASGHIAIGYQAFRGAGDAGSNGIAIGYQAGRNCASIGTSLFIGYQAGYTSTYWIGATCIGTNAGYSYNDPGTPYPGNFFVGDGAGRSVTTGTGNVMLGAGESGFSGGPGRNTTTGSQNTVLGTGAFTQNTTQSNSTAIGYATISQSTGEGNTACGSYAGSYNFGNGNATTSGTRNTFLGSYLIANGATDNNCIVIGSSLTGKGSTTGFISPGGGGVYQGNNSSSWSTTSDRRLKKNIADNNIGLEKITAIQVRNFEYRLPEEVEAELKPHDAIIKTGVQLGVIAQELQVVLPDCVKQETSGVLSVDPDNLTWYMINAIKELNAKIEAQAAEIAILKGQA